MICFFCRNETFFYPIDMTITLGNRQITIPKHLRHTCYDCRKNFLDRIDPDLSDYGLLADPDDRYAHGSCDQCMKRVIPGSLGWSSSVSSTKRDQTTPAITVYKGKRLCRACSGQIRHQHWLQIEKDIAKKN
jgi:hypothetical protein